VQRRTHARAAESAGLRQRQAQSAERAWRGRARRRAGGARRRRRRARWRCGSTRCAQAAARNAPAARAAQGRQLRRRCARAARARGRGGAVAPLSPRRGARAARRRAGAPACCLLLCCTACACVAGGWLRGGSEMGVLRWRQTRSPAWRTMDACILLLHSLLVQRAALRSCAALEGRTLRRSGLQCHLSNSHFCSARARLAVRPRLAPSACALPRAEALEHARRSGGRPPASCSLASHVARCRCCRRCRTHA
jgi:hypothetical protein